MKLDDDNVYHLPMDQSPTNLFTGDRRGKPLAFSDAMRIHDELSSPTKAVNLW